MSLTACTFVKNIGSAGIANSSTSTITVPGSGVPLGRTILVNGQGGTGVITGITDSRGNVYQRLFDNATTVQARTVSAWGCLVKTALVSADTIVVTFGQKTTNAASADEFIGLTLDVWFAKCAGGADTNRTTLPIDARVRRAPAFVLGLFSNKTGVFLNMSPGMGLGDSWHPLTRSITTASENLTPAYKTVVVPGTTTYMPTHAASAALDAVIVVLNIKDQRESSPLTQIFGRGSVQL